MNFQDSLDPELRTFFSAAPPAAAEVTVGMMRERINALAKVWRANATPRPSIQIKDLRAPGAAGAPDVLIRLYRPLNAKVALPALLWIHGGGFRIGAYDMDDAQCERIAEELGCLVASVEYRLAPEHPFPAAIDDAYAALTWLADKAESLGIDDNRIAIGGAGAGGGIAAGLALLGRDRNGPPIKFQLLIYPCVDDAHTTASSRMTTDPRLWNRATSVAAWKDYLGDAGAVSPYAAPARAEVLTGLPPAFVSVADQDILRDENIVYAHRLMQAGVATELHVYPGTFHGFYNYVPDAAVSQRAVADFIGALRRSFCV